MRDFLSHLVQRALQPQSELQPRLASRFEPAVDPVRPLAVWDPVKEDVHEEDVQPVRAAGQEMVTARTASSPPLASGASHTRDAVSQDRQPVPEDEALQTTRVTPGVVSSPGTGPSQFERPQRDSGSPEQPRDMRRPPGAISSGAMEDGAAGPTRATSRRDDRSRTSPPDAGLALPDRQERVSPAPLVPVIRPARLPTPVSVWEDDSLRRSHSNRAPVGGPHRPRGSSDTVRQSARVPRSAMDTPVVQPLVAERQMAPPRPRESHGVAGEPPAIQVTIGRVEVRATVAPTAARPAAPRKPALGLDEYLRQRSGAGR